MTSAESATPIRLRQNSQITGAKLDLVSKVRGGDIWVDQGIVAGCSGGRP